jgi:hypothetical protein
MKDSLFTLLPLPFCSFLQLGIDLENVDTRTPALLKKIADARARRRFSSISALRLHSQSNQGRGNPGLLRHIMIAHGG